MPAQHPSLDRSPESAAEEERYAQLQHMALNFARKGEAEPLDGMLRVGLPVNLADEKGNTLLMLASYHGNLEVVRLLLNYGAEVDRVNDRGQTPLGGVAFKGDVEIAQVLLQHGANLEADNGGGTTPLMFAAMFGRMDMVKLLQQAGASRQKRNKWGLSAHTMGWLAPAIWLLKKGLGKRKEKAKVLERIHH